MDSTDLFIIYLSGGAPLAVYYFLQNRDGGKTALFRLKTSLVFLFWLPFAVFLLLRNQNRRGFFNGNFFSSKFAQDAGAGKISTLQKRLEGILLDSDSNRSVFDFRETIERYVGLTLASGIDANRDSAREIFRAAKNKNDELGAICLNRRNRNKLVRHQTEARRDFLQLVEQIFDSISDARVLQHSTVEIVKTLKDDEAQQSLEKTFAGNLQIGKLSSVEYPEKDLWKPQERKPLRAETISTR